MDVVLLSCELLAVPKPHLTLVEVSGAARWLRVVGEAVHEQDRRPGRGELDARVVLHRVHPVQTPSSVSQGGRSDISHASPSKKETTSTAASANARPQPSHHR